MLRRLLTAAALVAATAQANAGSTVDLAAIPPGHIPEGRYEARIASSHVDIEDREPFRIVYRRGIVYIYNDNGDIRLIGRQTICGIYAEYTDTWGDYVSLLLTPTSDGVSGFIFSGGNYRYEYSAHLLLLPAD